MGFVIRYMCFIYEESADAVLYSPLNTSPLHQYKARHKGIDIGLLSTLHITKQHIPTQSSLDT
jgi:hypothetical protein